MNIGHLEHGRTEDFELEYSSYSQVYFVCTFAVFWVGRVIRDRGWCPIGVPHDPADDKMVNIIRDCTNCHSFIPDAHVS